MSERDRTMSVLDPEARRQLVGEGVTQIIRGSHDHGINLAGMREFHEACIDAMRTVAAGGRTHAELVELRNLCVREARRMDAEGFDDDNGPVFDALVNQAADAQRRLEMLAYVALLELGY